jgi:plasmid maintenance system antidote protein VapI
MIKYEVCLNQGNEALQTGKSITANEVLLTCDEKALAREIHHQNSLIPEDVAAQVLSYFGKAAAQLMAMGFAIQFKDGQDVLMRIYPDVHLKGGNINLQRAQELIPGTTDLTMENAGELATKVGVSVKVRCETEVKFTDMLEKEGYNVERQGVVEKAYVPRSGETTNADTTGNDNTGNGGDNGGGGNQGGGLGQN